MKNIALLTTLIVLLTSCYEKIDDCLDAQATNFALDADIACRDCCTYPVLEVDVSHKMIDEEGNTYNIGLSDSVYVDDFGNPFILDTITYYLSDFQLIKEDGTIDVPEEELEITTLTGEVFTTEDNFALVDVQLFDTYTIGTFRDVGKYTGLQFKVGLSSEVQTADPTQFSDDHPLSDTQGMYTDDTYILERIYIQTDTSSDVRTELNISNIEPTEISLVIDFEKVEGQDIDVELQADYQTWMDGIDVTLDTEASMQEKIVANLAQSFSLVEITH